MRRTLLTIVAGLSLVACTHSQQMAAASGAVAPRIAQSGIGSLQGDETIARMIREGTQNSHVDADLQYLLDVIGPRLTGSPGMRRANEWTQQKFREYGADRTDRGAPRAGHVQMRDQRERRLFRLLLAQRSVRLHLLEEPGPQMGLRLDDSAAAKLARDIAQAIQHQLTYPGEVKVTVLRETRNVEFAR